MAPELRVLVFVAAVAAVFASAAFLLSARLWRRLRRLPATPWSIPNRVLVTLAAAGLLCVPYGFFVEPFWPQVTRVAIHSPKLGERPVRIVEISDLHCDERPRLEERLPALIAAEKPDIIVFAGDAANSFEGIAVFRRLMKQLVAIAPTYVVRGNWDSPDRTASLFEGTGVRHLTGTPQRLDFGGSRIVLSGLDADSGASVEQAFLFIPKEEFRVFAHHFPDRIHEVSDDGVDLYLAGHTHGGQVALPLYGALITFSRYDKQFESGLYRVGRTSMYVNRGIGMEGGRAPRVRFWARPEITVLDLLR